MMGLFTKRVSVEEVIATFVKSIPRCVELAQQECQNSTTYNFKDGVLFPDDLVANISAAMYLFFLSGELPYNEGANMEKMQRAFQAMWTLVHHAGGNEVGAREWFQNFNAELAHLDSPPNRNSLTSGVVRRRLFSTEGECPFDILPPSISATVKVVRKFKLT